VCGRPADVQAQCPECGWVLRSPLRAGAVTAQLREEFTSRLRESQQALDARIVARISRDPGPYHNHIRGGAPDAVQWAVAQQEARLDAGDAADEETLRARLADLVDRLSQDTPVAVVEVNEAGVAVSRAGLDRFGTPSLDQPPTRAWASLLPMLADTKEELYFQLAGGFSQLDRSAISDRLQGGLIDPPHGELIDPPQGELLVICRPAGWQILEWAASLLAALPGAQFLRVAGLPGRAPAATVLASLTTEAPLREAYQLMVATVDDVSGKVATQARQIFAPGDVPGTKSRLSLRRPPGNTEDIALAIFSAGTAGDGEPLALYSVPSPPGIEFGLHAVLDGPGRVRVTAPPGAKVRAGTWAQVRSEIPDQVDLTAGPADLVCAVDLAGPVPTVRARLRLVRSLLERLTDEHAEAGRLRVSVLTCTDHNFERGRESRSVVRGTPLSPAPEALAWFARQSVSKMTYLEAAPIEDLLYEAAIKLAGARAAGRAARLLIVGSRRPHPYPRGIDRVQECPYHYKWKQTLRQLVGPAGARCVAVADAAPNDPTQAAMWRALGPAGLRWLPDATAQLIGEDLALLARHTQRIPIPLLNTE